MTETYYYKSGQCINITQAACGVIPVAVIRDQGKVWKPQQTEDLKKKWGLIAN
jgi:hypothetical protein